jgi:hypothetical protein
MILYISIYMYLLITGTAPPRVPKLVSARLLHIAAVSEKIRRSSGCSGSFGNVASWEIPWQIPELPYLELLGLQAWDFHGKSKWSVNLGLNHRISWDLNGNLNGSVIGLSSSIICFLVTSLIWEVGQCLKMGSNHNLYQCIINVWQFFWDNFWYVSIPWDILNHDSMIWLGVSGLSGNRDSMWFNIFNRDMTGDIIKKMTWCVWKWEIDPENGYEK